MVAGLYAVPPKAYSPVSVAREQLAQAAPFSAGKATAAPSIPFQSQLLMFASLGSIEDVILRGRRENGVPSGVNSA